MTIARKLLLLALLPIVLAFATVLVITWGYRQVDAARQKEHIANDVVRTVFALNLLTDEYSQHPGERPVEQWRQTHASLKELLGVLQFTGSEQHEILTRMERTDKEVLVLFDRLTAGGPESPTGSYKREAAEEFKQRLAGQLSTKLHTLASLAARAASASNAEALGVRDFTNLLVMGMVVLAAALQAGVSFLIGKSVMGPIARLQAATEGVGRGDFDQAVGTTARDEIGSLSRAFDTMTERLQSVTVSRDLLAAEVEARQQAEAALVQAKEAAEAANRAKSTFLANMSHEIRTPLNAVIGMTELVLKSHLSVQQREFLQTVRDSGEALLSVINDILDFSKIEAGKFALDCSTFDLRESLGDTMKSFAIRAHQQGLELACHIHPEVPHMVVGDYNRLRQIVVNLVGNSIKFTETGEVSLEVMRESHSEKDVVLHFVVADTGIGIPLEKQSAIFEMFEQADSSMKRRHGGTGLGLAIAARLVGLMGGRIFVESEIGRGSRFHFVVRLDLADNEPIEPLPPEPANLHGMRVLVVDDNATNRRILDEVLHSWQMVPTTVPNAAAAVKVLLEARESGEPYRLVLTDAHMPNVDGFSLAEQIKRDAEIGSTVVMMLTSGDRPEDTTRCEQLGIAAYLLKPIKQSELLEAIELAVGITVTREGLHKPAERQPSRVGRLRILLAEDSLVNQKLAVALLEGEGHAVRVAANGREALTAIEFENFDLILMDVQMPEMDGLEATTAIRAKEKQTGRHIPIIAMTAHALKGDRERCLECGMDAYIAKPIRADELFDAIDAFFTAPDEPAASAATPLPERDILAWPEALRAVRGDRRLLRVIVEAAAEETPRLMIAIREAVTGGDAAKLQLAAHTLKGAIRYFASGEGFEQVRHLEEMGRDKNLEGAEQSLAALEAEVRLLTAALSDYMQQDRRNGNS